MSDLDRLREAERVIDASLDSWLMAPIAMLLTLDDETFDVCVTVLTAIRQKDDEL